MQEDSDSDFYLPSYQKAKNNEYEVEGRMTKKEQSSSNYWSPLVIMMTRDKGHRTTARTYQQEQQHKTMYTHTIKAGPKKLRPILALVPKEHVT